MLTWGPKVLKERNERERERERQREREKRERESERERKREKDKEELKKKAKKYNCEIDTLTTRKKKNAHCAVRIVDDRGGRRATP